jgi:hypothetical protein
MKIKVLFWGMAQKSDDVKLLIGVLKHRLLVSRYPGSFCKQLLSSIYFRPDHQIYFLS